MIKNKYFILAVLCLAFILVRLPIILTSMDKIFDVNELYVGTIAKELIEGPSLPLFDYQLTHIKGGTLLAGIFVVPFFWLFGQSYFVLKLAALLVSLMILAVTYLFLWRFFSKRIAVIAGTLMTISAPLYTLFSLTLYGREHESILFAMAGSCFAEEAKPTSNPLAGIEINGYFDFYFQASPQAHAPIPATSAGPQVVEGTVFERNINQMTLNVAEISVKKKIGKVSFRADLALGEMVDQLSGGGSQSVTGTNAGQNPTNTAANEPTRNLTQAVLSLEISSYYSYPLPVSEFLSCRQ